MTSYWRVAAKIANTPPTIAANVTTLLADTEADPETSEGGSVLGAVVPGIMVIMVVALVGAAVGAAVSKSTPRSPAAPLGIEVGAALGVPVNVVDVPNEKDKGRGRTTNQIKAASNAKTCLLQH